MTKYVMSNTLTQSHWKNSVFLKSLADIEKLKKTDGSTQTTLITDVHAGLGTANLNQFGGVKIAPILRHEELTETY